MDRQYVEAIAKAMADANQEPALWRGYEYAAEPVINVIRLLDAAKVDSLVMSGIGSEGDYSRIHNIAIDQVREALNLPIAGVSVEDARRVLGEL